MKLFRDASIQHKQTIIIMLTTAVALLLACASVATYEAMTFRKEMIRDLETLGEIVGDNSAAAMDFNDPKAARETLAALKADPNIVGGCIYLRNGDVFAVYDRTNDVIAFTPPKFQMRGHYFRKDDLLLFDPIDYKGDTIGTVCLVSDMRALYSRLEKYGVIMTVVFLVAMLVAYLISARLQRLISGPILQLVKTARAVAADKNYSLRAVKQSEDELGALIDGFNDMLAQIQERDAALQKTHNELERRVEERTRELQLENSERKQAEAALAETSSLMEALLANSVDCIYFKDRQSRFVRYSRSMVPKFGETDPDTLKGKTDFDYFRDEHARPAFEDEQEIIRTGLPIISKAEKEIHTDGQITWALSTKLPWHDKAGNIIGTFGISKDITVIKEAEAKLEQAHKDLIDTSRQAGMAEVATSVLHNVGNVLNSVNISSSLVSEKVRKSRVANLAKVAALIQEHQNDLPAFFGQDPKGKQLPDYLSNLSSHLADEQKEIIQELGLLTGNIEHIKEIVAMQQSYARVSGVVESLKLADLMEDALRMNAGALDRHEVRVIREFDPALAITVEKHKVLQILVNLIRNAKYALDDGMPSEKQMTLRVAAQGDDRVRISIIDNGVGIPAENLTRIFGHGFTTRKEGHGFGLHSGALAARELGGSLTVHSDGPGKGACFTLEFPREPQKK